jgi:UDP-3-O-[3-hydroxymyristoyl] glucosamine N-acyltransferase
MFLYYQSNTPVYIIGQGPYAHELQSWLGHDATTHVIDHESLEKIPAGSQVMLGFQNIEYRTKFLLTNDTGRYVWPSFVHDTSIMADGVSIGPGTVVNPQCVIGHGVSIGSFNNIGIMSKIGHADVLGINVVTSPGTMIGGSTTIGDHVFFGQMCSIKDKLEISSNTYFAMNSVVSKNIVCPGKYVGNKKTFQ